MISHPLPPSSFLTFRSAIACLNKNSSATNSSYPPNSVLQKNARVAIRRKGGHTMTKLCWIEQVGSNVLPFEAERSRFHFLGGYSAVRTRLSVTIQVKQGETGSQASQIPRASQSPFSIIYRCLTTTIRLLMPASQTTPRTVKNSTSLFT